MYNVGDIQRAIDSVTRKLTAAAETDRIAMCIVITQEKSGSRRSSIIGHTYNVYEVLGYLENLKLDIMSQLEG